MTLGMADQDLPTRSASGFLLRWIAPRVEPFQLLGPLDRKSPVSFSLRQSDCLIAVGHGEPANFYGQWDQLLLSAQAIDLNVKDKVIVLISCQTARELGPALIAAGARAYIGWDEDVMWISDQDRAPIPWTDTLAQPVFIPIIDGLNALLDGRSAGEAFAVQQAGFQRTMAQEPDPLIAKLIQWNHDNAVLLGDSGARVKARPPLAAPFRVLPPPPMLFPPKPD